MAHWRAAAVSTRPRLAVSSTLKPCGSCCGSSHAPSRCAPLLRASSRRSVTAGSPLRVCSASGPHSHCSSASNTPSAASARNSSSRSNGISAAAKPGCSGSSCASRGATAARTLGIGLAQKAANSAGCVTSVASGSAVKSRTPAPRRRASSDCSSRVSTSTGRPCTEAGCSSSHSAAVATTSAAGWSKRASNSGSGAFAAAPCSGPCSAHCRFSQMASSAGASASLSRSQASSATHNASSVDRFGAAACSSRRDARRTSASADTSSISSRSACWLYRPGSCAMHSSAWARASASGEPNRAGSHGRAGVPAARRSRARPSAKRAVSSQWLASRCHTAGGSSASQKGLLSCRARAAKACTAAQRPCCISCSSACGWRSQRSGQASVRAVRRPGSGVARRQLRPPRWASQSASWRCSSCISTSQRL
jgi:hypothetical protein